MKSFKTFKESDSQSIKARMNDEVKRMWKTPSSDKKDDGTDSPKLATKDSSK